MVTPERRIFAARMPPERVAFPYAGRINIGGQGKAARAYSILITAIIGRAVGQVKRNMTAYMNTTAVSAALLSINIIMRKAN